MTNRPFPIEKYRFYQAGNKIIAVSTYAGGTVRGVSLCHPTDEFNLETGKKLAAARCNEKVAEKRMKRAKAKFAEAQEALLKAQADYDKMKSYLNDSVINYNEAAIATDTFIASLKNN
jgi:hypothetical protein